MGLSRSNCTNSIAPLHSSFSSKASILYATDDEEEEVKFRSLLHRMIWALGLPCFIPRSIRQRSDDEELKERSNKGNNFEHNKAWLLAESGGCGAELNSAEPQSVHSSFRFSFCSQVELESMNVNKSSSSATVLMVNLDNGMMDSRSRELKWKRIESLERSISPVAHFLVRFTYSEIVAATRNFSKGRVLGRGALSYVFRGKVGFLRTAVAIKRLDKEDKESSKAFCRELMIASSLHNSHIVPLVGFCIEPEEGLFLVYRFVSGGSLERYLHEKKKGANGGPALPWKARYKVSVGIAEAIGYLHNGTERCIVHRDIKPSNILLSSRKSAKLCDFGLATWTPAPSVPFLCKTVKGTFGYLAPEYFQHGKISDKTDVYAFGVVLLELLTGRKPIEARRGTGEENLIVWAKPLLEQGCVEKLLDPRLKFSQKYSNHVMQMVQAATACIHSEESRRPSISEIIAILRGGGGKANYYSSKKKANLAAGNNCVNECHSQLQQTTSEMRSHLALAMLGVAEFEDEEHLYCR